MKGITKIFQNEGLLNHLSKMQPVGFIETLKQNTMEEEYELLQDWNSPKFSFTKGTVKKRIEWEKNLEYHPDCFFKWFKKVEKDERDKFFEGYPMLMAKDNYFTKISVKEMLTNYARIKCKEQREICLKYASVNKYSGAVTEYIVTPSSVLNAPEPKL